MNINPDVKHYTITLPATIAQVMVVINRSRHGIALIVDQNRSLLGLVTDGDVRRGLISRLNLDDSIETVLNKNPAKATSGMSNKEILSLMRLYKVKHMPVVNKNNIIEDLFFSEDLLLDIGTEAIPLSVPDITQLEVQYIQKCVESSWISTAGGSIREFEEKLSRLFRVEHTVAVNSGTSALHTALMSAGIGAGHEVILPALTFIATANVVKYCGAEPVFCDIDPDTWNMDVEKTASLITPRTRAILPVHLLGNPVDIFPLRDICKQKGLYLIEDAAQAFGASIGNTYCGTIGHIGCLSFNGNKVISTGGGGALLTQDETFEKKARSLTTQGKSNNNRYHHNIVGYNYGMTNIHAAIGLAQLKRVAELTSARNDLHTIYRKYLEDIPGLVFQTIRPGAQPNFWLTGVKVDAALFGIDASLLNQQLNENNIRSSAIYPVIPDQPAYSQYRNRFDLENAHRVAADALLLPSSFSLQEEELLFIANVIKNTHQWALKQKRVFFN